jgi:hypothetical protein
MQNELLDKLKRYIRTLDKDITYIWESSDKRCCDLAEANTLTNVKYALLRLIETEEIPFKESV